MLRRNFSKKKGRKKIETLKKADLIKKHRSEFVIKIN
jgi:hypothetical protein